MQAVSMHQFRELLPYTSRYGLLLSSHHQKSVKTHFIFVFYINKIIILSSNQMLIYKITLSKQVNKNVRFFIIMTLKKLCSRSSIIARPVSFFSTYGATFLVGLFPLASIAEENDWPNCFRTSKHVFVTVISRLSYPKQKRDLTFFRHIISQ